MTGQVLEREDPARLWPTPPRDAIPLVPRRRLSGRTAVFLHAHPDDEAIFTGGTMRRLADLGARVVLVTATSGEEGTPLCRLAHGETLATRRTAELERAAEALGVARLVPLGYRDSGMPGSSANTHPSAFARTDPAHLARRLAELLHDENASVLVHYDDRGIYPHPDHLKVHAVGAAAAALAQVQTYETTVSRRCLTERPHHLLVRAIPADWPGPPGRPEQEIDVTVTCSPRELASKRRAMAEHSSQVAADAVLHPEVKETYGREWFLRDGPGVLDQVLQWVAVPSG